MVPTSPIGKTQSAEADSAPTIVEDNLLSEVQETVQKYDLRQPTIVDLPGPSRVPSNPEIPEDYVSWDLNPELPPNKEETLETSPNKEKSSKPPLNKGKAPKPETTDVFVLASRVKELLNGQSNRTIQKVFSMVGSLSGLRTISADRPIGQSTQGTKKLVPPVKPAKGDAPKPAAWRQTDAFKRLDAQRILLVNRLKSEPKGSALIETLVSDLRAIERSIKALHSPQSGESSSSA